MVRTAVATGRLERALDRLERALASEPAPVVAPASPDPEVVRALAERLDAAIARVRALVEA
ncbi:MAG: hypothetical protein H7840_16045 [Alphaproteobacteria bacterium]